MSIKGSQIYPNPQEGTFMNEEIHRIQLTIEQAEKRIAEADKWKKLLENPLFKELVTEGFLEKDATRITMSLKPGDENGIALDMLKAKMIFSRYVGNTIEEGYQAEQSLTEHRALLDETEAEG